MLKQLPAETSMRRLAFLLLCCTTLPGSLPAQSGARLLVPISPELLVPAEGELLACTRRGSADQFQVQRQPQGRYAPRTGETAPVTWAVTLVNSGRSLIIRMESGYRPREVVILNERPGANGAVQENVRVRFLTDGTVQDGHRAATPPSRDPGPATPLTSPLDSLDGPQLYALARELAFRCERGIFDPVPLGSIQGQIPPR
jgi:hypothetical protein